MTKLHEQIRQFFLLDNTMFLLLFLQEIYSFKNKISIIAYPINITIKEIMAERNRSFLFKNNYSLSVISCIYRRP